MNRQTLLREIVENVRKKHPWRISQEKYLKFFGELPGEFLNERLAFDNLVTKSKGFRLCNIELSNVTVEIQLSFDECVAWEIGRWDEAVFHNITPSDVKRELKPDRINR